MTTAPSTVSGSAAWWQAYRRRGFLFRQVAILTILMGLYLHISRAFLGDDLLLERVFTPTYDRVLTLPMTYAAITGVLAYRTFAFASAAQRRVYWVVWFYIAGSVPLHVYNAYLLDSTEYLRPFPMWWTYLLFPVYLAIIWFCWRLRPASARL